MAKRDAKEVNALAFQEAGGSPSILVFPWARPSFDAKFGRRKKLTDYFKNLGGLRVDFADFSDSSLVISDKVANADLVYLTGGQVSTLLSRLRKTGVDKLLCNYRGVVVGRSAGAMVFGRKCLVSSRYNRILRVVDGLGLLDFSIKAHYEPNKDSALMRFSKTEKIYAIPQKAVLIWDGCILKSMGEVFLFENGVKKRL